jgi:antitoxin component YwqK of YwqJK toxin-antitoxin module
MLLRINRYNLGLNDLQQYIYQGEPFVGIAYFKSNKTGQILCEASYYKGLMWGFSRGWHKNGNLEYERPHENGGDVGLCKVWYANGVLKKEYFEEESVRIWEKEWNRQGELVRDWTLPEDESDPSYRILLHRRNLPEYYKLQGWIWPEKNRI